MRARASDTPAAPRSTAPTIVMATTGTPTLTATGILRPMWRSIHPARLSSHLLRSGTCLLCDIGARPLRSQPPPRICCTNAHGDQYGSGLVHVRRYPGGLQLRLGLPVQLRRAP